MSLVVIAEPQWSRRTWTYRVKYIEKSANACWVYSVKRVSKMWSDLSIAFFILFAKCGILFVQLTHSSLGDQEDIFVTHPTLTTNHMHQPFPLLSYFSPAVCLMGLCHHIQSVVWYIWVRTHNCGCLVTWFCYQLIAKPVNKTAAVWWLGPYI